MLLPFPLHGGGEFARPDFSYRERRTTGSNLTTYTFSACDIGEAHPDRLVVVCVFSRTNTQNNVTIGGVTATRDAYYTGTANVYHAIYSLRVPAGTTADIVVTYNSTGDGCDIVIYAGYPDSATPVDIVSGGSGGGNITLSNCAKTDSGHGFVILFFSSNSSGSSMSASQNGPETLTEDSEWNAFSGASNRLASYSHVVTATSTIDDYFPVASGSNNEGATVISYA